MEGRALLPLLRAGIVPAQTAEILHHKADQEINETSKQQRCACLLSLMFSLLLCWLSLNSHSLFSYFITILWIVFLLSQCCVTSIGSNLSFCFNLYLYKQIRSNISEVNGCKSLKEIGLSSGTHHNGLFVLALDYHFSFPQETERGKEREKYLAHYNQTKIQCFYFIPWMQPWGRGGGSIQSNITRQVSLCYHQPTCSLLISKPATNFHLYNKTQDNI